jgi:hypothetical protein
VDEALKAYLDAFKADDYNAMYAKLSKVSQDAITLEDFAFRNRDAIEHNERRFLRLRGPVLTCKSPFGRGVVSGHVSHGAGR